MKLLVSDFDGTILFGQEVMQEDIDAIRAWREQGNLFGLITGRSKDSIERKIRQYDIPVDFLVTNNGAMILDEKGEILNMSKLDAITAMDLMFAAHEFDDVVSYVAIDEEDRYKVFIHPNLEEFYFLDLEPTREENELMDKSNFLQLVYSMRNEQSALEMAERINLYFGEQVHAYANNQLVYIIGHNTDKGTGLEYVAAYYDVDDPDVYAMGDSYNDLAMLEQAGNACALAVAPSEILANVEEVQPSLASYIQAILERGY